MRLASLMSAIAPIVFLSPDTGTPAGGAPPATPVEPDFTKAAGDFLGVSDEPVQDTTPASDAADTVAADAGDDTVAGGDDSETIAGDAAADTVAGDVKDDTPPAKDPEKPADKPADKPPVADPIKPFVEQMNTAATEYRTHDLELASARRDMAAARQANKDAVAKGDIITDEMHMRVYDAQERIDNALEKRAEASTKYSDAMYRRDQAVAQIRETGRQQWAASHAELADSPAEVLKAADKMYEDILAEVSKDTRFTSDEARQAVALDRLETKVRQTIDGKKAAKKDPPPQRKAPVRPTGGPLKGGNGATKTGEMEVSLESVEKMLGL